MALPSIKALADKIKQKLEADAGTSSVKWVKEPIDPTEPTLKFPHGNVVPVAAAAVPVYVPSSWKSTVQISVAVFVQNQDPAVAESQLEDLAVSVEKVLIDQQSLDGLVLYVNGIGVSYDGIPKEGVHWAQFDVEYEERSTT